MQLVNSVYCKELLGPNQISAQRRTITTESGKVTFLLYLNHVMSSGGLT